ncbi:MAG TPA: N-acetylmuramoyl-L-alanine amidase [Bacteroidales bacterium]|nr:N-acetylmuramoyl-L-alanine amidase [Bacteroidales bacterium]
MRFFLTCFLGLLLLPGFLSGQCDTVMTEALKGEGIYAMLRRNGYSASYFTEFIKINKASIGADSSLISGRKYRLPCKPAASNESENLSDPDNQDEPVDSLLQGSVFYIIAGHGGPDPGAVANIDNTMITEDEYAYDIALRLKREIESHSGVAYLIVTDPNDSIRNDRLLIHDTDELCYPGLEIPREQNSRLLQRVDAVNKLYDSIGASTHQRVVEIHLDSRADSQKIDVFFYYHTTSEKGKKLAEIMVETFEAKYREHQPNRGYKGSATPRSLMVLRKTKPVGVFMELGNITNSTDQKRFLNPDNRDALAKWICAGLITEYELYKKPK